MPHSKNSLNEVVVTRIFDAPCKLVWKAWTEPEHFKKWWGPKNCISPECEIDLKVGGKYLFCMQMNNGRIYWTTGIYKEIISNKKLVFSHSFADENGNVVPAAYYGFEGNYELEMEITVTLQEVNGKTKMILRQIGMPDSHTQPMITGWNESFDKLQESIILH